jgi:hypothetical protein
MFENIRFEYDGVIATLTINGDDRATMGGRFGGYGLYLLKGKPVFVYNLLI